MCGAVWMHLFLLRPPSWSLCPSRPAQWQRHNVSRCRQAQTRAELRLCRPVSCSSASVSVTYSQNVAERTTLCGVAAVPSPGFFSSPSSLPPLCWSRLAHSGCLLLSTSHFFRLGGLLGLNVSLSSEPGLNRARAEVSWPALWGIEKKSRQIHVRTVQALVRFVAIFQLCLVVRSSHLRMLSIMSARLLANGFGESGSELCREHMMVKTTWTARLELTLQFFTYSLLTSFQLNSNPF